METHLYTLHTLQAWVKLYTASFLLIGLATKLLKTERNSASLAVRVPYQIHCLLSDYPDLHFWNCLSYRNTNTSHNWFFFIIFFKEIYISSQCFDEVPSFHFHCGCILCRPAWLRQSIVALLYSGLKTRDGRGEGGGRKDDRRARAQSFQPGWWRLSAPLRYNSHQKPVGLAVQPCGSETFLVHTLKRPDFSQ